MRLKGIPELVGWFGCSSQIFGTQKCIQFCMQFSMQFGMQVCVECTIRLFPFFLPPSFPDPNPVIHKGVVKLVHSFLLITWRVQTKY
jgi:hypothetical protein